MTERSSIDSRRRFKEYELKNKNDFCLSYDHPDRADCVCRWILLGDFRFEFRELRLQVRSIAFVGTNKADIEKYIGATVQQAESVIRLLKHYEEIDPTASQRASYKNLQSARKDFYAFGHGQSQFRQCQRGR